MTKRTWLRSEFRADDVNNFARSNLLGGGFQLGEDRLESVQSVVRNAGNDHPEPQFVEVVLSRKSSIHCYEHVEAALRKIEERAILACAPACLGYALYQMTRKSLLQARRNALV